jgi:hypothetical protein
LEALQKPLLHETAGDETRLWIFDQIDSRGVEGKQGTNGQRLPAASCWSGVCMLRDLRIGDFAGLRE